MRGARWVLVVVLAAALCPGVGEARGRRKAGTARARPQPPAYARLQFGGTTGPTLYLRYSEGRLQIAHSEQELARAPRLRPERARLYHGEEAGPVWQATYAGVRVPGPIGRFTAVYVRPTVSRSVAEGPRRGRPDPPAWDEELVLDLSYIYRDRSGTVWEYVSAVLAPVTRTHAPQLAEPTDLAPPDPKGVAVVLHADGGAGYVYLTLRAEWGGCDLRALRRNGKAVPVRVAIAAPGGRTAHAASGSLWDFSLLNADLGCDAALPAGLYRVTAALGPTPFGGTLQASQVVVVQ